MKKKGIAPAVIIIMIVGVLVGLVVIYAIAFPGQLASKMRDALFSLGLGRLPEERMPSLETRVTGAVYLCDDDNCLDIPPSTPWRRVPESGSSGSDDDSIGRISDICNEEPSPEDSSDPSDPDKICGEIGSVAITGSYNVRLYEHENYLGATICIVQSVNLKKYDWNKKTKSVKLFESGECETQG